MIGGMWIARPELARPSGGRDCWIPSPLKSFPCTFLMDSEAIAVKTRGLEGKER